MTQRENLVQAKMPSNLALQRFCTLRVTDIGHD